MPGRVTPILAVLALCLGGASAQTPNELTSSELGNVLHCLDTKLKPVGSAPPRFESDSYRVRYVLGVIDKKEDEENKLTLVVYGKGEKRGFLYKSTSNMKGGGPPSTSAKAERLNRKKGSWSQMRFGADKQRTTMKNDSCALFPQSPR